MRITSFVPALIAVLAFSPAHAKVCTWYGGITFGQATASDIPVDDQEELDALENFEVDFEVNPHSTPYGLYLGCELPHGFGIEGSLIEGLGASINNHVLGGYLIPDTGVILGTSVTVIEEADVRAYGASAFWMFPPTKDVRGFIRLGGLYAMGTLSVTAKWDNDDVVTFSFKEQGVVPYAGLGLQLDHGKFHMRIEVQSLAARVTVVQTGIGWRFSD